MQTQTYALDATWRTLLSDLGISPQNALRRANLPEDLLQQASVRLPPESYFRFWEAIEAETGDACFPLRLARTIRSESFLPPLFAALCSPDLFVAVQRIARFKALVAPMDLAVIEGRGTVAIEFTWPDGPPPPASLVLMELLFVVALARMGTREAIRPVEVLTTRPPAPSDPYEQYLGLPIRRGGTHRVTFGASDAHRPFLTSNAAIWAVFEPELRQRLADLGAAVTTAARVHAALLEGLPSGRCSMEAIAAKLLMSKRTLQRRLEGEGRNFQHILQETRQSLARHYLLKTTLPIAEISFLLGFDEPNSFYRAFKNWTGRTPDGARQGQVAHGQSVLVH